MNFPEVESRPFNENLRYALEAEISADTGISGQLKHPVIGEVAMRPLDFKDSEAVRIEMRDDQRRNKEALITEIKEPVPDPHFVEIKETQTIKEIR